MPRHLVLRNVVQAIRMVRKCERLGILQDLLPKANEAFWYAQEQMVYCRYWIVENRRQNVLELAIAYLLVRWESRKSSIWLASNSAYPIFSKHWCDNSSHYCWLGFQHFRIGISSHERVQYCARSGNHPTTCSIIRLLRLTVGRRIYRRWSAQKSELIAKVYQPEKDLLKFIRCLKLSSLTCPTWTYFTDESQSSRQVRWSPPHHSSPYVQVPTTSGRGDITGAKPEVKPWDING